MEIPWLVIINFSAGNCSRDSQLVPATQKFTSPGGPLFGRRPVNPLMKSNTQAKLYRNRFSKGFKHCMASGAIRDIPLCLSTRQRIALFIEGKTVEKCPGVWFRVIAKIDFRIETVGSAPCSASTTSRRPNDSLAPAHSALPGVRLRRRGRRVYTFGLAVHRRRGKIWFRGALSNRKSILAIAIDPFSRMVRSECLDWKSGE